jgi:oxygen-independent coproporphyrinogen-3 oxidase
MAMFEARTGLPRASIAGQLALARERGWIEPDDERLRPTELGLRFANDAIALFLGDE